LKDYRLAAGLTQEALAERAGLSARAISDLERGVNRAPRQDTLDLLSQALALPPRRRVLLAAAARPFSESISALQSAIHPPHNLPVPPTRLIGRETDVIRAASWLTRSDVRLLTLTGPSGVGKTRVGLQVAEDLLDQFEDGVWFVALASIRDISLVIPTIAQTLEILISARELPLEHLKTALRPKHMLLVLDNFEQVAGAAPQIADLLGFCPGLKALVTSRAALHVRGEHELNIAPLEQEAAVTLFLQCAQAVQSSLEFTLETIQAATNICQRLDGLPLALELAAAHVKALPLVLLRDRLASRLALLRGGAVDLPERQRTMRDAIAWSYEMLSPDEQRLFRRLATFAGGCTVLAAEAVCGDDTGAEAILDGLEALVDKSLLRMETLPTGIPRYTMLEVIHDFALECLQASGEAELLCRRHLAYYLRVAQEAAHLGSGQDARDSALSLETANVRRALEWARGQQETGLGLRLLVDSSRTWYSYGMAAELGRWFDDLMALEPIAGERAASPSLRVEILYGLGRFALDQGQYERLEGLAKASLALAEELDERGGMGKALWLLGIVAQSRADLPEAMRLFEQALACAHEVGDASGVDMALISLGHVARAQGDYVRATRLLEEVLAHARAIHMTWGVANTLTSLALLARDQGDYARALALARESLTLHVAFGNKTYLAWNFEGIATIASGLGQHARATQLSAVAERLRQEVSAPRPPDEQQRYDQVLAAARSALGGAAFEQAWENGGALKSEVAMTLALDD
jgi:predicted ATPase/transcriptional regulator with XRE-family HTH domain